MKLCHDNDGAAIYVGRAAPRCTFLCFNVHTTVEYLNGNVSIDQYYCSNKFQNLLGVVPLKAKNFNKNI